MLKGFRICLKLLLAVAAIAVAVPANAIVELESGITEIELLDIQPVNNIPDVIDTTRLDLAPSRSAAKPSIYSLPYSLTTNVPDWKRLWINSAVYATAFGGTLLVLECLPEDATSWNRAAIQSVPAGRRWVSNIFHKGPEWDHDKFYFNYLLHPYAGAVYFMAARSAGFNFWRSFLYCSIVSNIGWEFGIEAFMERPSYQDLIITPVVGSIIGECFYKIKRRLSDNNYRLWGSSVMGGIVAWFVDPVNELTGLFCGNPARHRYRYNGNSSKSRYGASSMLMPTIIHGAPGFSFTCTF